MHWPVCATKTAGGQVISYQPHPEFGMTKPKLMSTVWASMRISQVIRVLNEMQADGILKDYAIGGAVGASFYLEPVSTVDIDVFSLFDSDNGLSIVNPQPVFDYLKEKGYQFEGEYVLIGNWPVQLLPPPGPLAEEAIREARTFDLEGTRVKVFSAEHLAALALQTGRAKDKLRLHQFIEEGAINAPQFLEIVRHHNLESAWDRFQQQLGSDAP
jgi:hypothetical protein